ncbi:hypothetical protein E2C01_050806 [Portunus trituberculatus]|uniref:Uncharacterized protein n=1 Tax=Portunus trituberculatus TaxID=210409 RepID=A0A5B7G9A5_PORTR|nr:hypothetical protein [Portunus trituberculatus]
MVVDSARIYQAKLEQCCTRYACAKRQGTVGASGSRFGAGDTPHRVVQVNSLSSVDSVIPQDLGSQAGQILPLEGQLATVFVHGSPLQSMLSDMIASQCLNNLAMLPASLLSQAECLASSRSTSPKLAAPSSARGTPSRGSIGRYLGHEPLSVHSGKHVTMADALLFTKWSQAEVGERKEACLSVASFGSRSRCGYK